MLPFLLAAALLTLLAGAFLAWPLLKRQTALLPAEDTANAVVYRDQKMELEAEFAAGRITAAERDSAALDLTRRLAADLAETPAGGVAQSPTTRPWLALVLVLALPLLGAALYWKLGSPAALVDDAGAPSVPTASEMTALVDRLAERMRQNPEDLTGWLLLARSQGALGRHPESAAAYAQADRLAPNDPEILANWASAEAQAAGGRLAGRPYELALKALAVDAQYAPALALAAAQELRAGDLAAARGHLQALLIQIPNESEEKPRIAALLAEIEASPAPAGKTK